MSDTVTTLPVDAIRPDPDQPRRTFDADSLEELARSIRRVGMISPIVVRGIASTADEPGHWRIVAGERRWRSAQLAGLERVPVIVSELPDDTVLEVQIAENVARADMNPIEEADGFARLRGRGMTYAQIGEAVGKPASFVESRLVLLNLDPDIQRLVARRQIATKSAEVIARFDRIEDQWTAVRAMVEKGLDNGELLAFCLQVAARRDQGELFPDVQTRARAAQDVRGRLFQSVDSAVSAINGFLDPRTMQLIPDAVAGDGQLVLDKLILLERATARLRKDVAAALAGRETGAW